MMAVLEAGGCFVPLDHSHPFERLNVSTQNVAARLILSSPRHRQLYESIHCDVMVIDGAALSQLPYPSLASGRLSSKENRSPSDAAYIIHTSGSTGKPKAIVVTHKQYCSGAYEGRRAML